MIANAVAAFGSMVRRGQEVIKAKDIVAVAQDTANNVAGEGSSILEGDIICFPATEDELKAQLIGMYFNQTQKTNKRPSIGLIVPVVRNKRIMTIRIFGGIFSRGLRPLNAAGDGPGEGFVYPAGEPAEDFRQSLASMYETWKSFNGKFVQVDRRSVMDVWGLKDNVTPDANGRFDPEKDYEKRQQRIAEFSYVDQAAVEAELGYKLDEA